MKVESLRRIAYILAIIGLSMIMLGVINIFVKSYIDSECDKTTDISWWVANCDYKEKK